MNENKMWEALRYAEPALWFNFDFSRVESHSTSPGIPDVEYCVNGRVGNIELKNLENPRCELRPTQIKWFRNRTRAGGNPLLLFSNKQDEFILLRGAHFMIADAYLNLKDRKEVEEGLKKHAWCITHDVNELFPFFYFAQDFEVMARCFPDPNVEVQSCLTIPEIQIEQLLRDQQK